MLTCVTIRFETATSVSGGTAPVGLTEAKSESAPAQYEDEGEPDDGGAQSASDGGSDDDGSYASQQDRRSDQGYRGARD